MGQVLGSCMSQTTRQRREAWTEGQTITKAGWSGGIRSSGWRVILTWRSIGEGEGVLKRLPLRAKNPFRLVRPWIPGPGDTKEKRLNDSEESEQGWKMGPRRVWTDLQARFPAPTRERGSERGKVPLSNVWTHRS